VHFELRHTGWERVSDADPEQYGCRANEPPGRVESRGARVDLVDDYERQPLVVARMYRPLRDVPHLGRDDAFTVVDARDGRRRSRNALRRLRGGETGGERCCQRDRSDDVFHG
jgi:hypothetical protein